MLHISLLLLAGGVRDLEVILRRLHLIGTEEGGRLTVHEVIIVGEAKGGGLRWHGQPSVSNGIMHELV